MGSSGGIPLELILFGMVAAFLVLRLRSILGRRTGFERPPQATPEARPEIEADNPVPPVNPTRNLPDATTTLGQTLARIEAVDRTVTPARFLSGAETAFPMIVSAFARGDRATLRKLLGDEVYPGFDSAITAREEAGHVQQFEIRGIRDADIVAADLRGTVADITVRFVSDQVNVTTAANGSVVEGTDAVTEIADVWTFQRDLALKDDPTWRLVATSTDQ